MGFFEVLQDFTHKIEMRRSKDEILFGEIVKYMVENYGPLVELTSMEGGKTAKFRTLKHSLLHSVQVHLIRYTGGGAITEATVGSISKIKMVAEIKNYVADPDDVLNMWKTDFQNITKLTLFGDVKVNHQMNSVLAVKEYFFKIGDVVQNTLEERKKIGDQMEEMLAELCKNLRSFKKEKQGTR